MAQSSKKIIVPDSYGLHKCPTVIMGFDVITKGRLPEKGTTLICGSASSCKTLFGINFLINSENNYKEPGIFLTFEETDDELHKNVASLNLDFNSLVLQKNTS